MDNEQIPQFGYKRPPLHTQFKPGESGNPNGRPKKKGSTFAEWVKREFDTLITLREGGRQRKITKGDAITKQLFNKAINGDLKAAAFLVSVLERGDSQGTDTLSPMLQELRALNAKHEAADQNGKGRSHDQD